MDLILGYLAGLLTLINPCVLPVLPIVLAGSLQTDPRAPLALAAGMGLSFVAVGTGVAAIGPALGIYPEDVTRIAALVMVGFGLVMVLPVLARRFSLASAGIAAAADARIAATPRGIGAEFAGGALLGAVWSPCIGPTLGAAIALASTGEGIGHAAAVMAAFAAGVATLFLSAAYGLRGWLRRNMGRAVALSARARPVMGWVFIAVGAALFLGLNHILDAAALQILPAWLVDLSVSI
ncbi:cytochrome c biogenesis protein CcdA [Rhodobacteraceae bacterium HSP-20]|uniref:Cytochrome c biogenesis protein CcdA n=1 Tax=Paragemmobacter amnigenus TaxID=2852097 RepID=A0ABS6IY96_9RHOB|nr:cytochrome c biogenesis protein CcdA [Rhodobacter amnigenus]MBU9696318.1 cytochrome c biogenesis protein CcdA [Rhodobacter amnigenus]MBV4387545.1 cytochrome c biogenesis protein CcdA [Rhodobacter amnigenus]